MRTDDADAQATAHQLVHCVLEADSIGLTQTLESVASQSEDDLRPYVREIVAELINVATAAVRDTAGPLRETAAFAIDLRDDDNDRVVIDDLEPPVRATIRALLAELNGSPDDASFQLDLAMRGVDHRSGLDTVRRVLTMTIGLLHWSEQPERLEAAMVEPAADDADRLEQELAVLDEELEEDPEPIGETTEADPADVQEQRRAVPDNEDDER